MINISISELRLSIYIALIGFLILLPFGFLLILTSIFHRGFKKGKKFEVIASEHEGYLKFCFLVCLIYLFSYLSTKINLVP